MSQLKTIDQESYNIFQPKNLEDAIKIATRIANSAFCPTNYKGKVDDVLVCMQFGHEIGLKPMQSLQNIAVINGRPAVWGDASLALVQSHHDFEYINEYEESNESICEIKRKNMPLVVRRFSDEDAKKAGLLNKSGTWQQYPKRMRQMRARGFALRDAFADALKGVILTEEASDYPTEKDITPTVSHKIQTILEKEGKENIEKMPFSTFSSEETEIAESDELKPIEIESEALKKPEAENKESVDLNQPITKRRLMLMDELKKLGVQRDRILANIGKSAIGALTEDDLIELHQLKTKIQNGTSVDEAFPVIN